VSTDAVVSVPAKTSVNILSTMASSVSDDLAAESVVVARNSLSMN